MKSSRKFTEISLFAMPTNANILRNIERWNGNTSGPTQMQYPAKFILWCILFVGLVVFGGCKLSKLSKPETLRIGAILPLTGDAAQYGINDKEGIMLAVNRANASGGIKGRRIEVLFEDCQTDAKQAVSAFNKLVAQGVEAIIDDAISTISLAMVPLLEPNGIVLISTGASNPSLTGASPFFFRIWNSDAYEGMITAEYIKKVSPTARVAILYINSDYGKGLYDVVTKSLADTEVKVVQTETYDKETRNFRSQIAKLKSVSPTVIYLVGYAPQTGPAARQIREAGVKALLIGTVAMEDPEFISLAGTAANNIVYPFPVAPTGAVVEEFRLAFRQTYGKDPGLLHDCGYDAANLIINAMRDGAMTGNEIRAKLTATKNFVGVSGLITFDANGDVSKPIQMKAVRNGKFTVIQ